jgi:hypothetical protein
MQLRRYFISAGLLIAYTAGLAHHLVPHCHHHEKISCDASEQTGQLYHAPHTSGNHRHFIHAGHVDEGLLGFLACLLSETPHPVTGDTHCFYTYPDTSRPGQPSKDFVLAYLQAAPRLKPVGASNFPARVDSRLSAGSGAEFSSTPHRGPPSLFI